jgi:MoaA/NifB/PqqE/SkfB family radical SAM enzyme
MNIVEVQQNWPNDLMRIDLTLGNYCNYKCWYCFPGCNDGTYKWPDFNLFVKNLSHMLDYYLANTNKKRFDFHVMGGEITHWPKFFNLIEYFKQKYDCIFTLTTNGSKSLDWWSSAAKYLDYVKISSHHEFTDVEHIRNVADLLYEKDVIVVVVVLMDSLAWDDCMDAVNFYKNSKHRWSIKYLEIILQDTIAYTSDQQKILGDLRVRGPNIFWFFKNNKSYRSKVAVVDNFGKTHKIKDQIIILERLNNFKDWECSLGVNWVAVRFDGTVSGICTNGLYESNEIFNIFEEDFIEKFSPKITPTICTQNSCWCGFETNMPKKKVSNTKFKKIIPIHEH